MRRPAKNSRAHPSRREPFFTSERGCFPHEHRKPRTVSCHASRAGRKIFEKELEIFSITMHTHRHHDLNDPRRFVESIMIAFISIVWALGKYMID